VSSSDALLYYLYDFELNGGVMEITTEKIPESKKDKREACSRCAYPEMTYTTLMTLPPIPLTQCPKCGFNYRTDRWKEKNHD